MTLRRSLAGDGACHVGNTINIKRQEGLEKGQLMATQKEKVEKETHKNQYGT